jgi:hypothetical protein
MRVSFSPSIPPPCRVHAPSSRVAWCLMCLVPCTHVSHSWPGCIVAGVSLMGCRSLPAACQAHGCSYLSPPCSAPLSLPGCAKQWLFCVVAGNRSACRLIAHCVLWSAWVLCHLLPCDYMVKLPSASWAHLSCLRIWWRSFVSASRVPRHSTCPEGVSLLGNIWGWAWSRMLVAPLNRALLSHIASPTLLVSRWRAESLATSNPAMRPPVCASCVCACVACGTCFSVVPVCLHGCVLADGLPRLCARQ